MTAAPISPGSSGSPVLNAHGAVVGIAELTFSGGQNLNFAIPAANLSTLLKHMTPVVPLSIGAPAKKDTSSAESTIEAPKEPPTTPTEPLVIPRLWMDLMDSESTVSVRIDGDYVYAQGKFSGDGRYIKEDSYLCEAKKQGSEWVGTCHFKVMLQWGWVLSPTWCAVDLKETITMLTPHRIEGEVQGFDSLTEKGCPFPVMQYNHFALIPKF